ncbi:Hypothetical predicted protein [Lynx pardinus]|uniref:Uncharacterized protein n=1 Tax=Lynx pardinus TaxID=191816 RepID=A0A485N391_LYNPA|nr:Hypothetical predicted protein [Lynx pardinus]
MLDKDPPTLRTRLKKRTNTTRGLTRVPDSHMAEAARKEPSLGLRPDPTLHPPSDRRNSQPLSGKAQE